METTHIYLYLILNYAFNYKIQCFFTKHRILAVFTNCQKSSCFLLKAPIQLPCYFLTFEGIFTIETRYLNKVLVDLPVKINEMTLIDFQ